MLRAKKAATVGDVSEDELASAASPAVNGGRKARTDEVTPKTVMKNLGPPRTRKKGTSAAPKTRVQAKMGVGVPAGGEETTPSARRTSVVKEVVQEERVEVNEGVDVVTAERKITPANAVESVKKRPSVGRPSLGTEGLVDPFAVPKEVVAAEDEGEAEVAPAAAKTAPTSKGHAPKKATPKAAAEIPAEEPKNLGKDIEVPADAVAALRDHVLGKVMGRQRLNLVGIDEEYK
jgi:hypothetical protein